MSAEVVQRFSKRNIDVLRKKVSGTSDEVIVSYLYAKAHGKAADLEIDSYPDGPSYIRLKRDAFDPFLQAWELSDGSFAVVRGDSKPDSGVRCLDLNDNVYLDTIALRSGHLSELQSMYGDMSGQFRGPGRLGSMMANISGKHDQVIALWKADRSIGCVGVLATLTLIGSTLFILR